VLWVAMSSSFGGLVGWRDGAGPNIILPVG
jgi:hypothetical protein